MLRVESSRNHTSLLVPGKTAFHKTGPWRHNGCRPLLGDGIISLIHREIVLPRLPYPFSGVLTHYSGVAPNSVYTVRPASLVLTHEADTNLKMDHRHFLLN